MMKPVYSSIKADIPVFAVYKHKPNKNLRIVIKAFAA